MHALVHDLRHAVRSLLRAPGYLVAVVATLALGIGANAAVFSAITAALYPRLPVRAPHELVNVYRDSGYHGIPDATVSYPDYADIRDRAEVFSGVLAFQYFWANASANGTARMVVVEAVTANYCQVLGIMPSLGRWLQPDEEQANAALAVISDRLWRTTFGAKPGVLGQTLRLKNRPYVVIGVMPPAFRGVFQPSILPTDVWLPLDQATGWGRPVNLTDRGQRLLLTKARLRQAVTLERAQARMSQLAGALDAADPPANSYERRRFGLRPTSSVRGNENMEPLAMRIARGGMAGVGLILVLACASIAHLLLARGTRRQAELAVRAALGAGRRRIGQLLLIESVILALAGGVGALGVARALIPLASWFQAQPYRGVALAVEPVLDGRVLMFTFVVSLATALAIGLVPAVRASKPDVARAFSGEGLLGPGRGTRRWFGRALIVTETALSLVLVLVAGLFARSFLGAELINPAFDTGQTAAIGVELGSHGFAEAQGRRFFDQLLAAAREIPLAPSVSLTSALPMSGEVNGGRRNAMIEREGASLEDPRETLSEPAARLAAVSPGYFRSIGLSVRRGRDFSDFDGPGSPMVAVVSETLAQRFWRGADPVGSRITMYVYGMDQPRSVEVIGVVADTGTTELDPRGLRDRPWIYVSFAQQYASGAYLVARTNGDPDALLEPLRRLVHQVNPDVAPAEIITLRQLVRNRFYLVRAGAALMGAFAVLALVLAIVGVYGVTAYVVSQRTREVGLRLALGASRGAILRLVLVEGLAGVGVGLATGVVLGLGAARLVSSLLFGIGAHDAVTFTAVPLLLLATACVACYVPAHRASRLSPMTVLRRS